jgi:hypothetical protein
MGKEPTGGAPDDRARDHGPSGDDTPMPKGESRRPADRHGRPTRDFSDLAQGLRETLDVSDTVELLAQLADLSERLWTPPGDGREPESFQGLVSTAEAHALTALLSAHGRRMAPWPVERLAEVPRDPGYGWRWEAAAVLVTGALAIGTAEEPGVDDPERLLDTLLQVAFGIDELTALTRRAVLIGVEDPWPPPFPDGDWPQLDPGCLMDIRAAGARLAQAIDMGR